ncbi:MAG: hypothetical protein U5K38_04890 [Woeseiaceae bacterium]|nr:hypothetical protein [Woeseiaceae bacterium]
MAARLPTRPIDAIATDYPGADPAAFGSIDEVPPQAMTAYGFIIDGIHYVSACRTRHGSYPNCNDMPLPTYSLAKSMVASLALMRAEYLSPRRRMRDLATTIDACHATQAAWHGVTIGHALDMATGQLRQQGAPAGRRRPGDRQQRSSSLKRSRKRKWPSCLQCLPPHG